MFLPFCLIPAGERKRIHRRGSWHQKDLTRHRETRVPRTSIRKIHIKVDVDADICVSSALIANQANDIDLSRVGVFCCLYVTVAVCKLGGSFVLNR